MGGRWVDDGGGWRSVGGRWVGDEGGWRIEVGVHVV